MVSYQYLIHYTTTICILQQKTQNQLLQMLPKSAIIILLYTRGKNMFYIKKALINKIIGKKKKNEPFDYQKAESFTITHKGDGTYNNSYYFSAHSYQKNESLYVRLGLRSDDSAETWVVYCKGDKTYRLPNMIYTAKDTPLKITRENGWGFSFEGNLVDDDQNEIFAKLNCNFISSSQPVDFFYHMPTNRVATAMAQDKWTKDYFNGVQENNSTHYEQEGLLTGDLILGDENIKIELPCLRDHSFGRRVWGYMNNHIWLAGVDDKCMFNFSMVSYPSMSILEVGHLRQGDNPVKFVTKTFYDRNTVVTGQIPKKLNLECKINDGRTVLVEAELISFVPYPFENGDYTLIEGIANLTIDGVKCRGILEAGFNKDKSRFMNGKKIEKIRE